MAVIHDGGDGRRWVSYDATISFVCTDADSEDDEQAVLAAALKAAAIALKGRQGSVGATGPVRNVPLGGDE